MKDQYVKTIKMLKYENTKFIDKLFPPGEASLFYGKNRKKEFSNIKWMRVE